jgi:hypothetical protein
LNAIEVGSAKTGVATEAAITTPAIAMALAHAKADASEPVAPQGVGSFQWPGRIGGLRAVSSSPRRLIDGDIAPDEEG